MIEMIGLKRILILAALAVTISVLSAGAYLYLIPKNEILERELRAVQGQISSTRQETSLLIEEFDQIQEMESYFKNLMSAGFFSDQNRMVASQRIEEIQKFTRVIAARYNIKSAKIEPSRLAEEAGYVVLDSQLTINIDAVDDLDIYSFIYWVENALPGHVSVRGVSLERSGEVNEDNLRRIGLGNPVSLVKSTIDFGWRTMVPRNVVDTGPEGGL